MALFGKNLGFNFGPEFDPQLGALPDYGTGLAAQVNQPGYAQPQAPKKKGFFKGGDGFDIWDIIGSLGDAFGGQPTYANAAQQHRKFAMDKEGEERDRTAKRDDWIFQQQWERDNPKPVNNDTANDYQMILERYGKEAADKYMWNSKIDPIRYLPTGDGGFSAIGGGGPPSGGGDNIPTISTPEQAAQLPPGAMYRAPDGSVRRKGGTSPSNGSGGFPGPY